LLTSTADKGTKGITNKVNENRIKAWRCFCDLKIVTHPVAVYDWITATISLASSHKK
jgi:hypothetical protein